MARCPHFEGAVEFTLMVGEKAFPATHQELCPACAQAYATRYVRLCPECEHPIEPGQPAIQGEFGHRGAMLLLHPDCLPGGVMPGKAGTWTEDGYRPPSRN